MALIKPILGQLSGSIAGNTFAHNKSGQYVRQRVTPTNPNTAFQQFYRGTFATTTARWKGLTQVQRDAWALYAANTPTTNRFGDTIYLDALNWYVAVQVIRVPAGLGFLDAAPIIFGLSPLTAPTQTVSAGAQVASIVFDNTDEWANATGGALVVQQARPQAQSINYFRGPWRPMQFILGDDILPPTSPDTNGVLAFPLAEDQKAFFRYRAMTADGRISAPVIAETIVVV